MMTVEQQLGFVRLMRKQMPNVPLATLVEQTVADPDRRQLILAELMSESMPLARTLSLSDQPASRWFEERQIDWYYWNRLQTYLATVKNRPSNMLDGLQDSSDRTLSYLVDPTADGTFRKQGLVVGYVQSGKTANYTALIARAADAGYKLIIVLTGIHNSLRKQTQERLDEELVGYSKARSKDVGVGRPDHAHLWVSGTSDLGGRAGDFNPGNIGPEMLAGTQPVLIVTKKQKDCLHQLDRWLEQAGTELLTSVSALVIDDEADQASLNTGGNRQSDEDEDSPAKLNEKIRLILKRLPKIAYVACTATPYANVLIDPQASDIEAGEDLYPKDFIIALPKPTGYSGVEEIFGTEERPAPNIWHMVSEADVKLLAPKKSRRKQAAALTASSNMPASLQTAVLDFLLAGAGRMQRGQTDEHATMLVHPSQEQGLHNQIGPMMEAEVEALRHDFQLDQPTLLARLQDRWDSDFVPVSVDMGVQAVPFSQIAPHIGPFLKSIEIRVVNSSSEDVLEYTKEKPLRVIVVGGNTLSRGLTIEGLLVSYFVRSASTYDTLMQMGRWFGYRQSYIDLTRLYTTQKLHAWFQALARVDQELRNEVARYDVEGKTPKQLAARVLLHPEMKVTSRLKMKAATKVTERVGLAGSVRQSYTFPLQDEPFQLANQEATRRFLGQLDGYRDPADRALWRQVPAQLVLDFLNEYQLDNTTDTAMERMETWQAYIRQQNAQGELVQWTVAVKGRGSKVEALGTFDFGVDGLEAVPMIERSLRSPNNVGVIVSEGDELAGLPKAAAEAAKKAKEAAEQGSLNSFARVQRPKEEGLLLIYPISRMSGQGPKKMPLYPVDAQAKPDVIGVALSFPDSATGETVEYVMVGVE